jgi:glucan phosphoethanolaminetransferase (alkaline phosphatase superfamily)
MVVGIMNAAKFLVSMLVFVFAIFLFQPLNEAVANMNQTAIGDLAPVVQNFPLIFILFVAFFPIYFGFKEART